MARPRLVGAWDDKTPRAALVKVSNEEPNAPLEFTNDWLVVVVVLCEGPHELASQRLDRGRRKNRRDSRAARDGTMGLTSPPAAVARAPTVDVEREGEGSVTSWRQCGGRLG